MQQLYKSSTDKKMMGVCGGLAEYFNLDSSLVRVLAIFAFLISSGSAIVLYILLGIILPYDYEVNQSKRNDQPEDSDWSDF